MISEDMVDFVKNLIPEALLKAVRPWYHGVLAWDANIYFDRPSERLVAIGITGTAGKSTTAHMLAHILNNSGTKAGYITTVDIFDGQKNYINKHGLSMPNEIALQKSLHTMVINKCKVAIIECTSEGLAQNRHWGINFDAAVITNLSNAHLEAHGGFVPYRAAKAKLFGSLMKGRRKPFFLKKVKGLNLDDPELRYFLKFGTDYSFGISMKDGEPDRVNKVYRGRATSEGLEIQGKHLRLGLPGVFNLQNALMAVASANMLGVSVEAAVGALAGFKNMPGRMEEIKNDKGFKIFVDYGCEPVSIKAALTAVREMPHGRIIHVFGATGGHRDIGKRFIFGQTSAESADVCIITNDDVYDSDPQKIADDIAAGMRQVESSKLKVKSVETILDRRQSIHRALSIAQPDDVVLITGKGSEQFLVLPGNKRIEWDEREVVREELNKIDQK
jgi:UDP-N-acetylmuramyl-tripeptide synthetase